MRRLVFVDDDGTKLDAFREIVEGSYNYTRIHWPDESAKLFNSAAPSIFVSDLYLPPESGDTTPTAEQRAAAAEFAREVGNHFSGLYADGSTDEKKRMRRTMEAISEAYELLKLQWTALGQSPDNGVALLARLKARYAEVPVVFYSRKITPEDVIRVLEAGAVDAIRKGALKKEEVLARLAKAQEI